MELLPSPKTIYLLEANMEVLHEESREWLNEINFWRDEIAFFYTLMVKKAGKDFSPEKKEDIKYIQEEILSMTGKEFDDLEEAINQHENFLASLAESDFLDDERSFREKHKIISAMIDNFDKRIRKLKTKIFLLIKQNLT